jgi:toxin YoeB
MPKAKEHLDFWIKTGNKTILKKILQLTKDIIKNPYSGIGKPEPLKHELTGYWSRRINQEHRFVYVVENERFMYIPSKGIIKPTPLFTSSHTEMRQIKKRVEY